MDNQVRISDLPLATGVESTSVVVGVVGGVTYQIPVSTLATSGLGFALLNGGNVFTGTQDITGNVNIVGALAVSTTASLGGAVSIGGALTAASTASVTGAVSLASSLTVGYTASVSGAASFATTVTIGGPLTVNGGIAFASNITVAGTASVTGAVGLASTLAVAGAVSFASSLTVGTTASVTGAVGMASTLTVANSITAGAGSTRSLLLQGDAAWPNMRGASGSSGVGISPVNSATNAAFRLTAATGQVNLEAVDGTYAAAFRSLFLGGSSVTLQVGGTTAVSVATGGGVALASSITVAGTASVTGAVGLASNLTVAGSGQAASLMVNGVIAGSNPGVCLLDIDASTGAGNARQWILGADNSTPATGQFQWYRAAANGSSAVQIARLSNSGGLTLASSIVVGGTASVTGAVSFATNVTIGSAGNPTTATIGVFAFVPSSTGAMTGAPTLPYTGAVPITYDRANQRLYIYSGTAWFQVQMATTP